MRRNEIARLGAIATSAAIGMTVFGPHALAQQPALCLPTYIAGMGTGDGILPGTSGESRMEVHACAAGDVIVVQGPIPTLVLGSLDPVDQKSGFRKAFTVRPCNLSAGSDLPGAKLTVSFQSDRPEANLKAMLTLAPDTEKPTLTTTSTPRKGTKVKPGDTIKIRMEASEEYSSNRTGWQTGVKKLQLIDESPNPVVTPHWEGAQMRACAAKQWKQFLEVTYTVPPNPPPVIRLRAIAEDFAGNRDEDVAEFPTGDWFGTIKKTAKGAGHNHTIDIDFAFGIEPSGNIKGRAHAKVKTQEGQVPGCTMLWTYSPSEFDIPLSGRRNGEAFEITLEPGTTTATITNTGPCAEGQPSNTFASSINPAAYGDTKFRISARDGEAYNVSAIQGALPWGVELDDRIVIHQARQ